MKKEVIVLIFLVIFLSFLVNASLVENSVWQNNLTGSTYFNSVAFGDIDNDNDLDMIQTGCSSGSLLSCSTADTTRIYINNGTSLIESFQWRQNLTAVGDSSIALGDIDNDGDLDLILGGGKVYIKIYINNGTSFIENNSWQQEIISQTSSTSSATLGDIDNDGDLDLVMVDSGVGNTTFLNNGSSFAGNSIWGNEGRYDTRVSSALVDLDNDFDLDSISIGYDYGSAYTNNGTTLELSSEWGTVNMDHASIGVGDADNDGNMDIFLMGLKGACGSNGNWFYKNNGSALTRNSTFEGDILGLFYGSVSFGDYDNNGYLDLALTGQCGGTQYSRVHNNDGTTFTRNLTETNLTATQSDSAVWADVDNDNDLDLVIIGLQKVYINNITTPNNLPTPPTDFSYSYNNREIKLGWINGSDNETISTGLYYNLKLGTSANNHSIISGKYGGQGDVSGGGGIAFGYYGNMMQRKNFTLKIDRLSPSTTYYWSVQTIDTGLKAGNWSMTQNFTTQADLERPNITLNSPVNYFNTSNYIITFNTTVFDNMNSSNVSLYANWTGSLALNQTNSSGINNTDYIFTANLTGYNDGSYTWMIQAEDNATNVENSSIRTFTLDTTSPNITITTSNNLNTTNTNLDVNYTVSDLTLSSCWYSNDTFTINNTLSNCANITSVIWSEGNHNVTIWANDSVGNVNSSSISFTIDTIPPSIFITTPSNNTNSSNTNLNINYTISDSGVGVESCWYSNDSYSLNTTLASCANITTINWSEGNHNVTIWTNDTLGNTNSTQVTFTIDTIPPSFDNARNFTVNVNNSFSENFSATDSYIGVGTYSLNDTSTFNISQNGIITNITNLSTLTVYWLNISVNDSLGNTNSTVFFINITSDFDSPNVTLISPVDSASYTSNSQSIIFSYNVSDYSSLSNCSLIINGVVNLTNTSINKSATNLITQTFTPASYTWNINCSDALLNVGNSSSRSFTVTAPATSSSSGGGGGGGATTPIFWTSTYVASDEVLKKGYVKVLSKKQRVKVKVNSEDHYVGVINLTETTAKINVSSTPQQKVMSVGEEWKVNVNNNSFYDLLVKLNEIKNEKANLTIKSISEEIPVVLDGVEGTEGDVNETIVNEEISGEEFEGEKSKLWAYGLIVGLIVIGGIVLVGIRFKAFDKILKFKSKKKIK